MQTRLPLLLLALAACDSQVDGTHNGDALANLSGNVANERTVPIGGDAEVVILWMNSSGSPDIAVAETVPVEGSFPAAFQLAIYEPPLDALINDYQDSRMGVAFIVSAVAGTDLINNDDGAGVLGMDVNHLLVYLPEDVQPNTNVAAVLRGTPKAGFHIYDVGHLTEAESEERAMCRDTLSPDASLQDLFETCGGHPSFDDFLTAPADLATPLQVDLVDDIEQLDIPNWT
jgi:hypothetical protein